MPATASPPMESPPQYSPALRRVTTGFGMGPGGSDALMATGISDPPNDWWAEELSMRDLSAKLRPAMADNLPLRSLVRARTHNDDPEFVSEVLSLREPAISDERSSRKRDIIIADRELEGFARSGYSPWREPLRPLDPSTSDNLHQRTVFMECPPSTIRTTQLRSVTCLPPVAYQPGSLPGVLPVKQWGSSSWGGIPA